MYPASSIPPEGSQDWQVNIRVLALPFSTQIPDRAVSQPIDCLMSNPRPGDTNRIPGTSGWREGMTAPSPDTPGTCRLVASWE